MVKESNPSVYKLAEKPSISKILNLAKNLSLDDQIQLSKKLDLLLKKEADQPKVEFSKFLLTGPVIDDANLETVMVQRKSLNQWRK